MAIETFRLLIGNQTTFYGLDTTVPYGNLTPSSVQGLPVYTLRTNRASNVVLIDFGATGEFKVLGREIVRLTFAFTDRVRVADMPWREGPTRYDKIDPDISAALEADLGQTIDVILDDVSVGMPPEMLRQLVANR